MRVWLSDDEAAQQRVWTVLVARVRKAERARVRRLAVKLRDAEAARPPLDCPRCYRQALDDLLTALKGRG